MLKAYPFFGKTGYYLSLNTGRRVSDCFCTSEMPPFLTQFTPSPVGAAGGVVSTEDST